MLSRIILSALLTITAACADDPDKDTVNSAQIEGLAVEKPTEAVILLKTHLQAYPQDSAARLLLAGVYYDLELWDDAESQARFVVESNGDATAALVLLSDLYITWRRYDDLVSLDLQAIDADSEEAARLFANKAVAHAALGEYSTAALFIESAEELDLAERFVGLANARIETLSGRPNEAMLLLDELIAAEPDNIGALLLRGDILMDAREWAGAIETYDRALRLRPAIKQARVNAALAKIYSGNHSAAETTLQPLQEHNQLRPLVLYAEGVSFFTQQRFDEAKPKLETALGMAPDLIPASYYAGVSNTVLGHIGIAQEQLRKFNESVPGDPLVSKILAELAMMQGEPKTAEALARDVLEENTMSLPATLMLASALLAQGDLDGGEQYLRVAVRNHPESLEARMELALKHLDANELDRAEGVLLDAIKLNPQASKPRELLVAARLRRGEVQEALSVVEAYLADFPEDKGPWNLQGAISLQQGQSEEAKAAFEKVLELDGADPTANSGLASLAMKSGDSDSAIAYYENVLTFEPTDSSTLGNLAAVYTQLGDTQKAEALLNQALDHHPEAVSLRLQLANLKIKNGEPDAVIALLKDEEGAAGTVVFHALLGEAFHAVGDHLAAIPHLEAVVNRQPGNLRAQELLTDAYARHGKISLALTTAGKLASENPDNPVILQRLVVLELQAKRYSSALIHADNLRALTDESPASLFYSGVAATGEGQLEEARTYFEQSFEKQPTSQTLIYYAEAMWQLGELDKSILLLSDWTSEFPKDEVALLELAGRYMSMEDWRAAKTAYETVLNRNPKSTMALNNLAWMHRDSDPERAVNLSSRLVELAPESGEAYDTHAVVLMNAGEVDEARKAADKAMRLAPNRHNIQFHRAQILVAADMQESAVTALQYLLEDGVDFPEREQAEALLARLKDS